MSFEDGLPRLSEALTKMKDEIIVAMLKWNHATREYEQIQKLFDAGDLTLAGDAYNALRKMENAKKLFDETQKKFDESYSKEFNE